MCFLGVVLLYQGRWYKQPDLVGKFFVALVVARVAYVEWWRPECQVFQLLRARQQIQGAVTSWVILMILKIPWAKIGFQCCCG